MNIWLCPIKPKSWRIIQTLKVFGFPACASKYVNKVRPNDLIIFHVFRPVNGIVAVCKVASEVFEDRSNIWGKSRYPLRVEVEFIPNFTRDKNNPIPISLLFYQSIGNDEIQIEPYLKNVWITKITQKQYERLEALFKNRQPQDE